nr:reverse transcriptase domain-containing protein [Tanacetum cinerariifolium]
MVDSQPMEEEVRGTEMGGMGMKPQKGPTEQAPETQTTPSPAFVMENIDMLRTMIKKQDQQVNARATPKKLVCGSSDEDDLDTSLPRHTPASVMDADESDRTRMVWRRTTIGMIRGCQLVDSAIILKALIEGFQVQRIYVDGGSSSVVMYEHCFQNIGIEMKAKLKESRTPLAGFFGEVNYLIGVIKLNVTMGDLGKLQTVVMEFAVVKSYSSYNVILGRTGMRSLRAVASTIHSMIKFPTANGIAIMITRKETLQECRRMEKAQAPILERKITLPRIQASELEETPIKEKEEIQEQNVKKEQPVKFRRPSSPPRKTKSPRVKNTRKRTISQGCRTEANPRRRKDGKNLRGLRRIHGHKKQTRAGHDKGHQRNIINTQKENMKLNPKKCSFRMEERQFLGYIVTSEGIRANPKKTKAVMNMPFMCNLNQMQRLSAEEAFQAMKKLIIEPPTLTSPMKDEELMVYLSVAYKAVSAVLLVERNERPLPIHYLSRSLQGPEVNYAPLEKLALGLVHDVRHLRRYFQVHTIKVVTDKPINQILNSHEASGRLEKWVVELVAYGITYATRNAIKGQVLTDFLAETLEEDGPTDARATKMDKTSIEGEVPEVRRATMDQVPIVPLDKADTWKLYTDGASNDYGKNYVRKFLRALHPKWRTKVTAIEESKDLTSLSLDELIGCGDPNHLIGECLKPPKDKNQRAFVGGSWSDSGEEDDEKVKDETCLVAHASRNPFNSKIFDVIIESFSPSPIPVEDSDLFIEEIDLFLASDGLIPLGIDSDYSDSEGNNIFLERLLHDDPIPIPDILDSSNVVRILPPLFTYPVTSSILLSSGSEDTIFDPDISNYHFSSFMPSVSHRSGTFMKFNVYPNHLNESLMEILSSTYSPMD